MFHLKSNLISEKEVEKINYYTFNNVRIIATYSVIVGHVADPLIISYSKYNIAEWWIGNFYISLFKSGIPIFIFLSSVLLVNKAKDNNFIFYRLKRILVPFFIWNTLYAIIKSKSLSFDFFGLLGWFLKTNSFHLWFIYVMAILYLLMPIIKVYLDKSFIKTLCTFALIYILLIFLFGVFHKELPNLILYVKGVQLISYIFFICLSVGLCNWILTRKMYLGVIIFVSGFFISFICTFIFVDQKVFLNGFFHTSFNLHIYFKGLGLVIIVHCATLIINKNINSFLSMISKYCYGIFFIHPLVLKILNYFHFPFKYTFWKFIFSIPLNSLACFIVSLVTIYFISKLPFGKALY